MTGDTLQEISHQLFITAGESDQMIVYFLPIRTVLNQMMRCFYLEKEEWGFFVVDFWESLSHCVKRVQKNKNSLYFTGPLILYKFPGNFQSNLKILKSNY